MRRDAASEPPTVRLPALPLASHLTLRDVERRHILSTLREANGNRTATARMLGISVRCLQYKLREYARDDLADGVVGDLRPEPVT